MTQFDPHRNFASSVVAVAPAPAAAGASLTLLAGQGVLFPDPAVSGAFNCTVWPMGSLPTIANAEIIRVTARVGDVLTIARAQEGSVAQPIAVGMAIALTITAKILTDLEALLSSGSLPINVKDYGAVGDGLTDDTVAVLSALAAKGATADIELFFPDGTYKMALGLIGAGGTLGGRNIRFRAAHPYRTKFAATSPTAPIFTVLGSGDTTSDYFEMEHIGLQGAAADRDYDKPLLVCKLLHGFDFHHLRLASADGNPYTGTWIQIDSCFEGEFDKIQCRTGKYGVPVEILNATNSPYGGGPPQIDTIGFRRFVVNGCQGVVVRNGVKEIHGLVFDRYKVVNTTFYLTNPNVETTLNGATLVGDSSIVVASAAGIVIGDCITVDHSGNFEINKVTNVAGTTLTLAKPLQFAHATGMPIMVGGWCASLGDNIHAVKFMGFHSEGHMVAVGAGAVQTLDIEGYNGAGEILRVNGNTQRVRIGPTQMRGTSNKNQAIQRGAYNTSSSDGYWLCEGPFTLDSGAPTGAMTIDPPHNTRNWRSRSTSSALISEKVNAQLGTAGDVWILQNNGVVVARKTWSGAGRFTDGVQTKYLSSAGKASVADADFTQVPTDGTLAVVRDSTLGTPRLFGRINGSHLQLGTRSRYQAMLEGLGYVAETFPRPTTNGGLAWTAQQVRGGAVWLEAGDVVSFIEAVLNTAPGTPANLTAGRLVVFDSTGRKWAITADCSVAFQGTLDLKQVAVASVWDGVSAYAAASTWTVTVPGLYYPCAWFDGTSMPSLAVGRGVVGIGSALSGKSFAHVLQSGQASVPDTATLVVSQTPVWLGLSS